VGSRGCVVQKQHHKHFAFGYNTCLHVHGISLLEAERSFYHNFRLKTADRKANILIIKVKVTLVQALRLCTGRTAHRGSRGIALPFLDHGTIRG